MKALPVFLALATAAALSGCSVTANEAPCRNFEAAYNSVDLEAKEASKDSGGTSYGAALKLLADKTEPDAEKALGEVQRYMMDVVMGQVRFADAGTSRANGDYTVSDVRAELKDSFVGVAKACNDSGYPISLKLDHPTS
jgi:alkanesulfonate monooxygenase SsuD/methylene tetrahydromethanopterin reductase-like flavin-dependent oxidoreductase (luciferase family)